MSTTTLVPTDTFGIDLGDRTEVLDRAPPVRTRGTILAGLVVVFGILGGFVAWAALTPIASAVIAHGTIVVESNRREVQHLDGGIVAAVHVREGDFVTAGQPLISLDPTRPRANLEVLQNQELTLLAVAARLRAEQLGRDAIEFPPALLAAARLDPRAREAIEAQQALFAARRDALTGQIDILGQRIAQLRAQLEGLRLQQAAAARQARLIEEEIAGLRSLERQGFAPRNRILAMERELARYRSDEAEHMGNAARTEQAIGETELQILQTRRQAVEEASRQLQDTLLQLRDVRERLAAARDLVERLEIVAPIDGRIVGLQVTAPGGVIAPGRTLLAVVPDDDELVIDVQIPTHQIESVVVGAEAVIHFTALPQRTLPMLTGTVIMVGADKLVDDRTGFPYYRARVRVDDASLAKLGDRRLLPGMPADVVIAGAERTVLSYLVDPLVTALMRTFRER